MDETRRRNIVVPAVSVFVGLPVLFWALGDFPRRTVLKESLSMGTLLAFSLVLGVFLLTRGNRAAVTGLTMRTTVTLHKIIGYIVVVVLLLHPFFIVIPRYFESGVAPKEAFVTMVTTWESPGIVLGIIAWCLMLILGVVSLLRKRLPLKYTTWRTVHGVLAILFIIPATWHAVDLGRHMNRPMSIYVVVLAGCGVLLLVRTYILKPSKDRKDESQ